MTATTKKSYVDQMQELIDKQRKIARKEGREGGVQFCLGFSNLTDEQIARNFCPDAHGPYHRQTHKPCSPARPGTHGHGLPQ